MPAEDGFEECHAGNNVTDMSRNGIMAGTLLGSILIFIPISRYFLLILELYSLQFFSNK